MLIMLPSAQFGGPSLADVLPSCLASCGVSGVENRLGLRAAQSTILIVADGLGAQNISAAKAHCRFLAPALTKASTLSTVFPSTTAAALASLTTGTFPGTHGMLGYRIRDPDTGQLVNQLTGLGSIPALESWLGSKPLYNRARADGIRPVVVAHPRFASTPLTQLIHEGADVASARTIADRCDQAISLVTAAPSVVILYISELDEIAHAQGVGSHAWASKLEEVDSELQRLSRTVPNGVSIYLTADHGVIDIPENHHVEFGKDASMLVGVTGIGGEPRCLQLFLDEGVVQSVMIESWREALGDAAYVCSRSEFIESGWFGPVSDANVERLGDIFVLARKEVVFFDVRDPTNKARKMVGHHGGISPAEMKIPFLTLH